MLSEAVCQTEYHYLAVHLNWQMGKTCHTSSVLWPKLVLEKTVKFVHIGYHITPGGTTPRLDCNVYHMYISNSLLFSGVSLLL